MGWKKKKKGTEVRDFCSLSCLQIYHVNQENTSVVLLSKRFYKVNSIRIVVLFKRGEERTYEDDSSSPGPCLYSSQV